MNVTEIKSKKVAVILGGLSKERDVSLRTGSAISKALVKRGYDVLNFDPAKEAWSDFLKQNVGVAFIALHGKYGEDGCVQGLLECLKIPYTGAGVLSSSLCFDKIRTKRMVEPKGVLTPRYWIYERGQDVDAFILQFKLKPPVVAKPNCEGSSFGTTIVRDAASLKSAIKNAAEFSQSVLIEEFIDGSELTVGVLNGKALSTVEIVPKEGFYDYTAKYTPGKTDYYSPARLPEEVQDKLKKISETAVAALDCRGSPRVDFMVDKNHNCYFLEVNTIPGMTETSLLPKAAKAVGIEFDELCERILLAARLDYELVGAASCRE